MIILDTNVISEAMRGHRAEPAVLNWIRSLTSQPVTTVINRAEVLAGVALLPNGKRKDRLTTAATAAFDGLGVCLPMTSEAANEYADIVAVRRRTGRPIGAMDALIAAICRAADAQLATREVTDFDGLGLNITNPWG